MDTLLLEVKLKDHNNHLVLKITRPVTIGTAGKVAQEEADNFASQFKARRAKNGDT